MTDIRTTKTIEIDEEYRVTVAEAGDQWEAAVTATRLSGIGRTLSLAISPNSDGWRGEREAPRVYGDGEYAAAGKAVEAYIDWLLDDDESETPGMGDSTDVMVSE